ncbi:MAG: GNAT family N-acetyltransferase [Pirellulales bacterium]
MTLVGMDEFTFQLEPELDAAEWASVMERSTLAERRPKMTTAELQQMIAQSDVLVTARHAGKLIGVSRALTDFWQSTYLADLAVDVDYQRCGIGRELVRLTHDAAGRRTMLVLLAAPAAEKYYPHIGFQPHHSCWIVPRPAG